MARALIVGCGRRGRDLGNRLIERDWQVRGTSRSAQGLEAIENAGIEAALADPDSPGTVLELVGDVAVVVWLLGSAAGEPAQLKAVHGSRLERLLEKLVDTPVRGFAYEASGSVPVATLEAGRRIAERAEQTWRIRLLVLDGDRGAGPGWADDAARQVEGLLAPGPVSGRPRR